MAWPPRSLSTNQSDCLCFIAIAINQQSLSTSAPTKSAQFGHHLSLLSSHSSSQCRDSLAFLTTAIAARASHTLPEPFGVMARQLLPLIYHESASVRAQLLKLFRVLPFGDVRDHVEQFIMHIRLGMTRIVPAIRMDSVETLSWLLDAAGEQAVSCAGGWAKLLKCFLAVFGWEASSSSKQPWTSQSLNLAKSPAGGDKIIARQLQVFGQFLRVGIAPPEEPSGDDSPFHHQTCYPLWDIEHHLLPMRSNCYGYLNLFGPQRDEEAEQFEDIEGRQSFLLRYQPTIATSLEETKKHGGEPGRAAAVVHKVLTTAMASFAGGDD